MWLRFFILTASFAIIVSSKKVKNDIEVKADIRMDPSLIKHLKQSLEDELELGFFRGQSDPDVPVMEVIKDNALHELLKENLPELSSEIGALSTKIHTFEKRSQQKGKDSLQAIADHVHTKLNLSEADVVPIVKKITKDYMAVLYKYFSDLTRESPDCQVDEEFIILDMVNVVPLIRANIARKLLYKILSLARGTPHGEIEILTGTLQTFNDNDKRQELDFMCAAFKVCRPNPTFTNYVYKLLEEVLQLNNAKFMYFLTRCSQLLLNKQMVLDTVLPKDIESLVRGKLNNMATANVTQMREAVTFLHSIVTRRYKINHTNNKTIQTKAKSAYIILDIVDTAFGLDGNDLYGTQLSKTISLVREWSQQKSNDTADIDTALYDLIQYIIEALNYNLTQRAREEIIVLADIIYNTNTEKNNGTGYLLTEGSKFVKGLLNRPEPKNLW